MYRKFLVRIIRDRAESSGLGQRGSGAHKQQGPDHSAVTSAEQVVLAGSSGQ